MMNESQYNMLQDQLSNKIDNNPYKRTGNFSREDGYNEGILAAKSILSSYYHGCCQKEDKNG